MYSDAQVAALYDVLNQPGPDDDFYLELVLDACLVDDEDLRASLAALRRAVVDGGRFAFETRNPGARAWEDWHGRLLSAVDPSGTRVRVSYDVEQLEGDVVTSTETTIDDGGAPLRVDRASLRFLDVDELDRLLVDAGFRVEERYGGWRREPFTADGPEIVTIARRGAAG